MMLVFVTCMLGMVVGSYHIAIGDVTNGLLIILIGVTIAK